MRVNWLTATATARLTYCPVWGVAALTATHASCQSTQEQQQQQQIAASTRSSQTVAAVVVLVVGVWLQFAHWTQKKKIYIYTAKIYEQFFVWVLWRFLWSRRLVLHLREHAPAHEPSSSPIRAAAPLPKRLSRHQLWLRFVLDACKRSSNMFWLLD